MKAATMLVELRGPDGHPREGAGPGHPRALDLVAVKGTLAKVPRWRADAGRGQRTAGYRRDRPKSQAGVKFP